MDPYRYELASIWHKQHHMHHTHAGEPFHSTVEFGVLTSGTTFARVVMSNESHDCLGKLDVHTPFEQWLQRHQHWFYEQQDGHVTGVPLSAVRDQLPKVKLSYPFGVSEDVVQWLQSVAEEYAFAQHIWILPDGKKARAMITYYLESLDVQACKQEFVSSCNEWDQEGIRLVLFETIPSERRFEVYL